jgi:hypothetical protein
MFAALDKTVRMSGLCVHGVPRRAPLLNGFRSAVFLPNRDGSCIHGTIASVSNAEERC